MTNLRTRPLWWRTIRGRRQRRRARGRCRVGPETVSSYLDRRQSTISLWRESGQRDQLVNPLDTIDETEAVRKEELEERVLQEEVGLLLVYST